MTSTMPAMRFGNLATTWSAVHVADQMLLAWLPLWLVSHGVGPGGVSAVVAAHAAAWLLVSLPVGAYADAMPRRRIMIAGSTAVACGAMLGLLASISGLLTALPLGLMAFTSASGVVAVVLAVFALLPQVVDRGRLASANAGLEFARASICILAPLAAAYLISRNAPAAVFGIVLAAGMIALVAAAALPQELRAASAQPPLAQSIREGAKFVARQPLLRAIALCAIAWNSAFFALTAVFAPYAVQALDLSVAETARAWSVYGIGLVLGALAAPVMIARLPTGFMFVFGPAMSAAGVAIMALMARKGETTLVWLAFFSLGFGPMTWLVLQTSVRQIVTPPELLGRVGAVITTAIYGVRPLAALVAGLVASAFGPAGAIWMAALLFVVSLAAILLSPAARLTAMPTPSLP